MTVTREAFLQAVESCVGTPCKHMGRTIGVALDCVGVPIAALAAAGGPLIETGTYANPPGAGALLAALHEHAVEIGPEAMQPGDLMVVLWKGEPRHVVVYAGTDEHSRMLGVRADGDAGKVTRSSIERGMRVATCWRLKEVS